MASKRGSLIKEGTLAPQPDSLLENILSRGRAVAPPAEGVPEYNADPESPPVPTAPAEVDPPDESHLPAPAVTARAKRSSKASRLLQPRSETGPLIAITTRLPAELDEWLESEVFRRRRDGIRKQDLIAAGLRLLREDISDQE